MNSKEIREQTAHATRWSVFTEIAAKMILPITNMILARLLTPEMFGGVATVTLVISFADMFADAGFHKYLVQHDYKTDDELNKGTDVAFWTNLLVSVLLWLGILVFCEPIAALVGNPGKGNAIVVAGLALPLTSFSSIQAARFRRDFDFKTLFYARIVTALLPLVITVPLAVFTRNYWALIIGTLADKLVNATILTWRSKWKPSFYYNFRALKDMFSYSWWILLESIATWLTSNIGTFVVGIYLTQYYLGLYKTAMSTVNQILSLITASTSAPLFVAMSKLKDQDEKLKDTYCKFIGAISFLLIPMSIGCWLYRDFITQVLLGGQWLEASSFVGAWGLVSAITLLLGSYPNGLYNAKGKTFLSFATQVLHLVVLIPVLFWAAPKGFVFLWCARCLVRLQLIVVQQFVMKFYMKISLREQLSGTVPPVVGTLVMVVVSLGLQLCGSTFLWQLISVAICILVYFAVCFGFFREQLLSALATIGFDFKRRK